MTVSNAISTGNQPDQGALANAGSFFSTDDIFRLSGPSVRLDPRINAYRDGLADIALAGRVLAPHYAKPLTRACGAHASYLRSKPASDASIVTELLPGEGFAVLEYAGGWAWGYGLTDHVVGYVEAITLASPVAATHVVCERAAPVSPDARVTAPVLAELPIGSRLHGEEAGACLSTEYGLVPLSHLRRLGDADCDPVIVAERMLGVRWLHGGRGPAGIDASGLVQLAVSLCGVAVPRFADAQATMGAEVQPGAPLKRGDLIFAGEAAGLMIDDLMLIHADRAAGKVTTAPYASLTGPETIRRRLPL